MTNSIEVASLAELPQTNRGMVRKIDQAIEECELANLNGRRFDSPSYKVLELIEFLRGGASVEKKEKLWIPRNNQEALDLLFVLQGDYLLGGSDADPHLAKPNRKVPAEVLEPRSRSRAGRR